MEVLLIVLALLAIPASAVVAGARSARRPSSPPAMIPRLLFAEEPHGTSDMISCPSCAREISRHAAACPGCGCPATRWSRSKVFAEVFGLLGSAFTWGFTVPFVLLLLCVIVYLLAR